MARDPRVAGGSASGDRQRALRRAWLAVTLLGIAVLLGAFHDRSWYPPDEGAYADVARRVLAGEKLHREVEDLHAGAINLVNAAALALFGESLVSLRYPLVAASALAALAAFLLLARRDLVAAAVGGVATVVLGVLQFLNPTAHWYCLALFFGLALWLEARPPARRRGVGARELVAGLAVAACFLFRQLSGVLLAIGVVAFFLLEEPPADRPAAGGAGGRRGLDRGALALCAIGLAGYFAGWSNLAGWLLFGFAPLAVLVDGALGRRHGASRLPALAPGLAAGFTLGVAPMALFHLAQGTLGGWIDDLVFAAGAQAASGFLAERSFLELAGDGLAALVTGPSLAARVNGLFWAALPFAAPLLGLAVFARRRAGASARAIGALPVLALFFAPVAIHNQIPIYLAYSLPAVLCGLLWLAAGGHGASRRLAIGAVAAATLVGLVFHAGQPVGRGWDGIVRGERRPAVATAGTALDRADLRVDPQDLAAYTRLLATIERETEPGEAIFAFPCNPELYFLSRRANPFRFFNTAIGVRGPDDERRVIERLESDPPALLFHAPADKYATPFSRRLMERLAPRYEPLGEVRGIEVYRIESSPSDRSAAAREGADQGGARKADSPSADLARRATRARPGEAPAPAGGPWGWGPDPHRSMAHFFGAGGWDSPR